MKKRLTAILAIMGSTLLLASLAGAAGREVDMPVFRKAPEPTEEKDTKTEAGKTDPAEKNAQAAPVGEPKAEADKKAPRGPASSREIISSDTVEYMKDAGRKVERIFEPIGKK